MKKRFYLLMFLCLYGLSIYANDNIKGDWKGVFVVNGKIAENLEWIITKDTIKILILNTKGKKIWKNTSYHYDRMQIILDEEDKTVFNILSVQKGKRLIIGNSYDKYILYQKKEKEYENILSKIPYENSFKGNKLLEEYTFSFTEVNEYTKILTVSQKDSLISAFNIGHNFDKISQVLAFEFDDDKIIDFLIIEEVKGNYIKVLLNGEISFQLNKKNFEKVIKPVTLINNRIVKKNGTENSYELNLNRTHTISVGKISFDLNRNETGTHYAFHVFEYKRETEDENIEWFLSNNKLLFIIYPDFHDIINIYFVERITETKWSLKGSEIYLHRYKKY